MKPPLKKYFTIAALLFGVALLGLIFGFKLAEIKRTLPKKKALSETKIKVLSSLEKEKLRITMPPRKRRRKSKKKPEVPFEDIVFSSPKSPLQNFKKEQYTENSDIPSKFSSQSLFQVWNIFHFKGTVNRKHFLLFLLSKWIMNLLFTILFANILSFLNIDESMMIALFSSPALTTILFSATYIKRYRDGGISPWVHCIDVLIAVMVAIFAPFFKEKYPTKDYYPLVILVGFVSACSFNIVLLAKHSVEEFRLKKIQEAFRFG